jgi:hypothetical protein
MMLAAATVTALLAWIGLCLAMDRHYRQVIGRAPRPILRHALRFIGSLGLALSLAICVHALGGSFGPVAWFGLLSIAALAVTFLLPYVTARR